MLHCISLSPPPCAVGQATLAPPGGLPPAITPQFVLFTHDDAIIDTTFDMLHEVTDGRLANGCPLTATLFTQVQGTGAACCVLCGVLPPSLPKPI